MKPARVKNYSSKTLKIIKTNKKSVSSCDSETARRINQHCYNKILMLENNLKFFFMAIKFFRMLKYIAFPPPTNFKPKCIFPIFKKIIKRNTFLSNYLSCLQPLSSARLWHSWSRSQPRLEPVVNACADTPNADLMSLHWVFVPEYLVCMC